MADLKTTNIFGDAYINNKVGIATNAPATRLQIGQLSPTAATEGLQFGDDTGARLHRINTGHIRSTGGFSSATFIIADNYLQTNNNLIYPASQTATQRLEVGNASGNAWVTGISIAQGGNVTVYNNLTVSNAATVTNDLTVNGNTYLGNANNDTVYVNDTIRIGATDSGDASLFFGEGSVAGSDYGARWYWDSGYTFTWYTRNAGTDTALFDYVTNDLNYINWRRHFHMQNKEINYNAQVHFNAGTRFVGNNTSYLNFRSDSTGAGGILVQDGNATTKGYTGYWDSAGGGILNNTGNWAVRYNFGNANSGGTLYGAWTVNGNISASNLSGTNTGDQTIGNGTITIAAGTGIGVGTTNTFTMNQSGATTVTVTNSGVTSNVAGTGISVSGATGAVTITNSSPNATHTGDVTGATALTIANDAVTTVKILNANVTNAKLANSSLTIGSTAISLGATATTIAGLTSVTSTTFVGALTGNATTATALTSMNISQFTNNSGYLTSAVTSLAGTTNRITVSGATGAVTLNLPQDIHTGASPTFAGLSLTSVSTTGATITNLTGAYQNTTVYDSPRTQSATPSRGIRAPASSIQFTDSYAIAPFYTYRSTGDWPVPYGIGWGTGGESSGIFQRYASNGSSFGDMIFYTGNDGSGAFSFRRHTWEGTTYFAAGSGELNTELFRVDWAGKATAISFGLTGGFVIDATGAYGQFNNWVHLPGYHGFYSSNNGAHIYPNNGSYGSWRISGTRNSWYGLEFDSGVCLMMNSSEVGFYRIGSGWQMRWYAGTGYVYKGNPGGGTEATILDSSNYTSYTPGLGTNNTLTGINVINNTSNTLINNQSGNLGLTMFQATAGTDAYMTFHIGGDYAAYLGLGGAENDLVYGGWSAGNNRHRILHSGNSPYAWNMNQYVRTTDSPTFNTVTANITGNAYNNLSNDYKDIYVYGDVNTYYVVLIQGEYLYSFGRYSVTRGYNWTGPDTWHIATHKGGLTLDWEWSGDTAWGGNDKAIRIIEFNESYSTMVAGLGYPVNGGVIIWLRGGGVNGALYRIRTPVGSNATVTVYDNLSIANHVASTTFTAADSTVFSTRANTNNVSAEILARYPVRGAALLYNENNAVLHAGNYNSYSPTLTGTGASGTWSINVTGNAATATTLQTARNINGTSFNGSAAITTATWGTARTLTIGSTGKSVDGSAAITWSLAEIGAAATNGASNQNFSANSIYPYEWIRFMVDAGIYWQSGTYAGWHIHPQAAWGMSFRSAGATDCGLQLKRSDATSLGAVYSDGTSIGFLTAAFGWGASWTLAGAMNRGSVPGSLVTGNISGNAATATTTDNINGRPFVNTNSNSGTNADTINSNGISYYTSGVTNFSGNATDGALFSQAYSNDWQHQIAGDYRSGQIALRGKNGGTWQSWRRVLDQTNASYAWNMNQNVRTADTVSFAAVTATTFTGALSGNATSATSATSATTATNSGCITSDTGNVGENRLQYWQTSGNTTLNPDGEWYNAIRMGHGNPVTYYGNTLAVKMTGTNLGDIYTRTLTNGTQGSWNRFWNNNNDGAGSGLDADLVDGLDVHTGRNDNANKVVRTDSNGYINAGWINTPSGDMPDTQSINRIYCSDDQFIRYKGVADFKQQIGLTYKNATPRSANTTDTNYWTGIMGWTGTDWNSMSDWGCGFVDSWDSPANRPPVGTHHVGIQAIHYTNGTARYGWQMANGGGNNRWWLRDSWGSSFSTWFEILTSTNYTSFSPSLTGTGASGNWGINVTGNAATATNATTAGGLAVQSGANYDANKIVRTDGNGYILAGWINTISGDNGTTAIDRVYASQDGYIRYYTPANFRTVLDVPTRNGSGVTNFGINTAPSNRLHINGDGTNPAIRVDNGAVVLAASAASNSKTFYGWLPISIAGTTKWIQMYN
jgi:hypothetical protein